MPHSCLSPAVALSFVLGIASAASAEVSLSGPKWRLANEKLSVTLDPQTGGLTILDKAGSHRWIQAAIPAPKEPRLRKAQDLGGPGARMAAEANFSNKPAEWLNLTLELPPAAADLVINVDMADREREIGSIPFFEPLVLENAAGVIVAPDYGQHLYPADLKPLPRTYWAGSRLDMPWMGMCDLRSGAAMMMILLTSDNANFQAVSLKPQQREQCGLRIAWSPSKGRFAYPRQVIYHFGQGGYVGLCKRYRAQAANEGLMVPFTEKVKKNANLRKLFGAPDVWGHASLKFAQEAKKAGVEKMIIHGRNKPEEMRAINALGYITSEYDNYTDVLPIEPGKPLGRDRDQIPESVVLKADGQRMKAWLTFDKKQQYMKRCPALWMRTAKATVPHLLETYPFVGRFVDVTTAEDLYECFDPQHPLTKSQKRQAGVDLLAYLRSLGLVMGGEHGIWWAVPQLDYIEGMMSGGYTSWPAGHLIHPKTKDQEFTGPWGNKNPKWEQYAKWGIGHEYRAPLWDLVFHDCIVSTWYWGDASDFLLDAAPEITPKKDAFNVLHGTIPLLWANREGSWVKARDLFLRTYRNTCKLHEAIATAELLSHQFVTPDRSVQRTRFSDGTETIVNFGPKPYPAELAGKTYLLPTNGWAVHGPKINQSRSLLDGRIVTRIEAGKYRFEETEPTPDRS